MRANIVLTHSTGATFAELKAITPKYVEWEAVNTNVRPPRQRSMQTHPLTLMLQTYLTDANGTPYEAQRACKEHGGCRNSDLTQTPPRYAQCYIPDKI